MLKPELRYKINRTIEEIPTQGKKPIQAEVYIDTDNKLDGIKSALIARSLDDALNKLKNKIRKSGLLDELEKHYRYIKPSAKKNNPRKSFTGKNRTKKPTVKKEVSNGSKSIPNPIPIDPIAE